MTNFPKYITAKWYSKFGTFILQDNVDVVFAAVAATLMNSPVQIPRQRGAALGRHAKKYRPAEAGLQGYGVFFVGMSTKTKVTTYIEN